MFDFIVSALKALQREHELQYEQHKRTFSAAEAATAEKVAATAKAAAAKGAAAAEAAAAKGVAAAEAAAQREREARKLEMAALEARLQKVEQDRQRSSSLEAQVRWLQAQWQTCQKFWTEQCPALLSVNAGLAEGLTAAHKRIAKLEDAIIAGLQRQKDVIIAGLQRQKAAEAQAAQLHAEVTALGARLAQADQFKYDCAMVSLCTLLASDN